MEIVTWYGQGGGRELEGGAREWLERGTGWGAEFGLLGKAARNLLSPSLRSDQCVLGEELAGLSLRWQCCRSCVTPSRADTPHRVAFRGAASFVLQI